MNTHKESQQASKTHLNVEALKRLNNYCTTLKGNHTTTAPTIEVPLTGYDEIGNILESILNVINKLSEQKDNSNGNEIFVLSQLALKFIPHAEFECLDRLLFKTQISSKQTFIPIAQATS